MKGVPLAEVHGVENLGRQVKKLLAVLPGLPGPTASVGDAAILLPNSAEHFDLESAAAAGHIHNADSVKLPQERLRRRKVMLFLPEQRDDLAHSGANNASTRLLAIGVVMGAGV